MPSKHDPKDGSKASLKATSKTAKPVPALDSGTHVKSKKQKSPRGDGKDVAASMAAHVLKKEPVAEPHNAEIADGGAVAKAPQPSAECGACKGQKRSLEADNKDPGVKLEKLKGSSVDEFKPAPDDPTNSCHFCSWVGREIKRRKRSSGDHSGSAAALISCPVCSEKGVSFHTSDLKFVDDSTIRDKENHLTIAVFPRSAQDALQDIIDNAMSSVKKSEAAITQAEHDIRICRERIESKNTSLVRLRPCLIEFDAKSKGDQEIRKRIQQFVDEVNELRAQIDEKSVSVEHSLKPALQKEREKLELLETVVKGIL